MRNDLDHLMSRLADARPERSLDGFEHVVLQGVAKRREELQAAQALTPVRVASIGVALAIGVTTGGMAAASTLTQPPQVSPFSTVAHLAPSTLLEGE
ncbi:MAG: hypothetical protein Q7V13_09750 [Phenylobacterium sp.]|uniref:hypothetical protein n=1 Tax=Phenylobacterium sp. TaxID=1871053 RepID=UPI002725F44A|nr:hypothetical protein [Phenylobacterium sp.]MDO8912123.1 hypothetical protein [Phenylobacterium sp.]